MALVQPFRSVNLVSGFGVNPDQILDSEDFFSLGMVKKKEKSSDN